MGDGQYQQGVRQTRSQGPVYLPDTPTGEVQLPHFYETNRLGRLASRWIQDFLDGKLGVEFGVENQQLQSLLGCPSAVHHDMIGIPMQSYSKDDKQPAHPEEWTVSCHCKQCRRYFTVRGYRLNDACCDGKAYRMHHLVRDVKTPMDARSEREKYWPIIGRVRYFCSAVACRDQIIIEVTEPRIPQEWMEKLVRSESTMQRLQELTEQDPSRFQELNSPDKIVRLLPINYFQQYTTDICFPLQKNKDGLKVLVARLDQPLKVARRNKILQTCFGDEFEEFFRSVEFNLTEDREYMLIPRLELPPEDKREEPSSRRSFFHDLKLEADVLCDKCEIGPSTREGSRLKTWAYKEIEALLGSLLNVPTAATSAKTDVSKYESRDFDILGVTRNTHESLLWFACMAQGRNMPSMRSTVFEALKRVSQDRVYNSEELRKYLEEEEIELVKQQSLQDAQPQIPDALAQAYRSFSVDPTSTDDHIKGVFGVYHGSAKSPVVRFKHRKSLSVIAEERHSKELSDTACDTKTMDIAEARAGLEVDATTSGDMLPTVATIRADDNEDKKLIAATLKVLSEEYPENKVPIMAKAAQLDPTRYGGAFQDSSEAGGRPTESEILDLSLPTGLDNIRNTCYLNSSLQYLNTIKVVWDIVLNKDNCRLESTEENLASRRLDGTNSRHLTRGEAFVGRFFADGLGELFKNLQDSHDRSIRPRQSLALAALKTADQLSKRVTTHSPKTFGPEVRPTEDQNPPPPPLPARPSPKPPLVPPRDSNEPTVTVNAVSEHLETASNVSSQTLVNQPDDEDHSYVNISHEAAAKGTLASNQPSISDPQLHKSADAENSEDAQMTGGAPESLPKAKDDDKMEDVPPPTEVDVEDTILEALNDTTVTGTDQQDVEEIMGNVLEHLRAAIKAMGLDPDTGFQTDLITEIFYLKLAKYLREVDASGKPKSTFRRSIEPSRWITAFPSKDGKIGIYEALDSNFDQEFQEGDTSLEQFTSIVKAPSILHIYIQRGQNEAGVLGRNNQILEIPQLLYLDRYMDSAEGSELFKKRQRSWNIKRRLRELGGSATETQQSTTPATRIDEPDYVVIEDYSNDDTTVDSTPSSFSTLGGKLEDDMRTEGISLRVVASENEDIAMASSHGSLKAQLSPDTAKVLNLKVPEEEAALRQELDGLFADMNQQRYHVHAVICHGGGLSSGHYWTWIYDFEQDVWRQYNDSTVKVEAKTEEVLKELNSSSNPYYVAYVRESDAHELVAVPRRTAVSNAPGTDAQDIEMQDVLVEHVEDGDPPPYTPDLA